MDSLCRKSRRQPITFGCLLRLFDWLVLRLARNFTCSTYTGDSVLPAELLCV